MDNQEKNNCCGRACEDGFCAGCSCIHHMVMPILVISFGATFLAGELGLLAGATVSLIWPIIVMIAGLKKLFAGMCKCC